MNFINIHKRNSRQQPFRPSLHDGKTYIRIFQRHPIKFPSKIIRYALHSKCEPHVIIHFLRITNCIAAFFYQLLKSTYTGYLPHCVVLFYCFRFGKKNCLSQFILSSEWGFVEQTKIYLIWFLFETLGECHFWTICLVVRFHCFHLPFISGWTEFLALLLMSFLFPLNTL